MTIDPLSVPPFGMAVVPIEALLGDAEVIARKRLIEAGFDESEIDVCVSGPVDAFFKFEEERHPLLSEPRFNYEIQILQHSRNIRNWLDSPEWTGGHILKPEEWVSHGYMLGLLQYLSTGVDRVKSIMTARQRGVASIPSRTRNPMADEVINDFRNKYESPSNQDIKRFGRFIGKYKVFDDLNIEVIEARNANKRVIYNFKFPGSKRISEIVTRDGIRKKLKKLAKKDKK